MIASDSEFRDWCREHRGQFRRDETIALCRVPTFSDNEIRVGLDRTENTVLVDGRTGSLTDHSLHREVDTFLVRGGGHLLEVSTGDSYEQVTP